MQKTSIKYLGEIVCYGLFLLCFKVDDPKEMELSGKDTVLSRLTNLWTQKLQEGINEFLPLKVVLLTRRKLKGLKIQLMSHHTQLKEVRMFLEAQLME